MANSYADDFLTCVMKRTDSDVVLRIGSVLLLMFGVPILMFVMIFTLVPMEETGVEVLEYLLEIFAPGLILFSAILEAFITYMMINAYYMHHVRDIVWMKALAGYASSYGKDVSELESINSTFSSNKSETIRKVAIVYFLFVLLSHTAMAIMISTKTIDGQLATDVSYATSLVMLLETCLGSAYVFACIRKDDNLQCDFTSKWAALMANEMPEAEAMVTRIQLRRLWPHLILMLVTAGIYSLFFSLWTIHTVNLHISRQNTYEESVIRWIMDKEGAKGIQGIVDDRVPNFLERIIAMFT